MSILKLTKNDIIRNDDKDNDDKDKIKLNRNNISYDSTIINAWEQNNREALETLNSYTERINKSEWLTEDDRTAYRKALDTYIDTANRLRGINKTFGAGYTEEEEKAWADSIASMNEGYDGISKFYSQFSSDSEYNKWHKAYTVQEDAKVALNTEDFAEYSQLGTTVENPTWEQSRAPINLFGWKPLGEGKTINNMVTFAEENRDHHTTYDSYVQDLARGDEDLFINVSLINSYMTDEEKSIYNYYVGKGDTAKANEYLTYILDILHQREANTFVDQADNNALELVYSVAAGANRFAEGILSIDDMIMGKEGSSTSSLDYAHAEMSSNNEGVWKVSNDLVNTTANMLPSMFVGAATGGLGGALTLGASSSGNAYSEMRQLGYDRGQATAYAAMTGASEAALSYALGGISKLGGKVTGNVLGKAVAGIDNAIARVAIEVGGSMASEALEEAVQEMLDPVFKMLATGEDFEGINWENVAYSALLGALSGGLLEGAPTIAGNMMLAGSATSFDSNLAEYYAGEVLSANPNDAHALRMMDRLSSGKSVSQYQTQRMMQNAEIARIVNMAAEVDPANTFAQRMKARLDEGKYISPEQVEKLAKGTEKTLWTQDRDTIKSAVKSRLTELGEKDEGGKIADKIVKAIEKVANGRTSSESVIKSFKEGSIGRAVIEDVLSKNPGEWTRQISTKRIMPDVFHKVVKNETVSVPDQIDTPEDGKVTMVKDDEDVEVLVRRITSFEGGKLTFELESGERVSEDDLHFGEGRGLVYKVASEMATMGGYNLDTISLFATGYDSAIGNISAREYIEGWLASYRYGAQGLPIGQLKKGEYTSKLTSKVRERAYNLGKINGENKVFREQTKVEKRPRIKEKRKGALTYAEGIDRSKLTEIQRVSIDALAVLADKLGVNIEIFESPLVDGKRVGENGRFDPRTNTIYIDLYAGKEGNSLMLFTASHELTHFIKEWSPAKFKTFADALFVEYNKRGESIEKLIQTKYESVVANALRRHIKMTKAEAYEIAYEEVVADACEAMLVDSDALQRISKEIWSKDKSLWEKIKDFIVNLVNAIKEAYKGLNPDSEEGKLTRKMHKAAESLQQLWTDALIDAGKRSSRTDIESSSSSESGVRYSYSSISYSFFGDDSVSIEDFESGKYRETEGYRRYVDQCLSNMRQTTIGRFNEAEATKEIKDSIDGIVRVAVAMKKAGYDIFDNGAKRGARDSKDRLLFSSLEPNSDYFTSSDISTICDKRLNFAEIYDEIVRREEALHVPKGKRFFDNVDNYFILHKIMADKGLTQPCRQCYVESMRKNLAPMANAFLRLMQETDPNNKANDQLFHPKGKSKGTPKTNNAKLRENLLAAIAEAEYDITVDKLTVEMLTTEDGLAQLKLQAPLIYEAFNSFYGQSKPKMPKSATPFRFGELTALLTDHKGKIKKSLVDQIMSTGGFRLQSYSDFQIQNFADVLQVIFEAGTLGLSGHAYTKVPAFLDATKGTNLKRNISIFMYNDGGQWRIDRNDSFPYDLDAIYDIVKNDESGNTSIIAVSQNEMMAAWIMANDNVGYFIPFHKSGMKMGTVRETIVREGGREIKGYSGIKDHTRQQTEVWAFANADHKAYTKVKRAINIYDFWDFDNADNLSREELIKKNLMAYIDACNEAGYLPKFREYVMNNSKVLNSILTYAKQLGFVAQDATIDDISFEYKGYRIPYGYYKCLGDFGMFNAKGEASPIERLSLKDYNFDEAEAFFSNAETLRRNEILQQIANGEERERYRNSDMTTAEIAEEVQAKRNQVVEEVVSGEYKRMRYSERDSSYMDAVTRGDMETAQQMVDEAAREAGYTYKGYHGTPRGGFTEFQSHMPGMIEGVKSIFLAKDEGTAGQYAYGNNRKVYSLYAKMNSPLIVDCGHSEATSIFTGNKPEIRELARKYLRDAWETFSPTDNLTTDQIGYLALRSGKYDGVIFKNVNDSYYNRRVTDVYEVFDPEQVKSADPVTYDNNREVIPLSERFNTENSDIRYSEREFPSDAEDVAKEYFGTTTKWSETGWLLLDGTQLDFSGRHWERYPEFEIALGEATYNGKRNAEHYEIADAFPNLRDMSSMEHRGELLDGFLRRGNIRIVGKGMLDLKTMPTEEQFEKLRGYFRENIDKHIVVGIGLDGLEFKSGTNASTIIEGIRDYFSNNRSHQSDLMRFHTKYSERESQKPSYAPTFYSHMGKVIDGIKMEKMGAGGVVSYLKGKGVKDEEIKWSGIEAFLEGKKSVTKTELQEFVAGSQLQIEEEMSGVEAWDIVKEGEDYIVKDKDGNILDTWFRTQAPDDPDLMGWMSEEEGDIVSTVEEIREYTSDWYGGEGTRWSQYRLDGGSNYRELVFKMPNATHSNQAMRAHWGQDAEGVLAHARIQDFEVDGKRMLFIEEIQSDWHNEGHQRGYTTEEYEEAVATYNRLMEDHLKKRKAFHQYVLSDDFNRDQSEGNYTKFNELRSESESAEKRMQAAERDVDALKGKGVGDVPDAPFRSTYHEYVLKRLLRMAAEEGYDSIGWTPAQIQSERWSEVYAEGYRIEYDQDIPKFLRKYGKKWGATVGTTLLGGDDIEALGRAELDAQAGMLDAEDALAVARLRGNQAEIERLNLEYLAAKSEYAKAMKKSAEASEGTKVWSMDIPDSMKDSVLYEGQVLYSERNTASFNGQAFWSGSVSLLDGVIEEVHTMEEAEGADYHHSMYFSPAQVEKMENGENAFFWVDNGKVQGNWRESIPHNIIKRIEEQIKISPATVEAREFSDVDVRYSIREEDPPKRTMEGYKVFVVKDGKLYPPMVANPNAEDTPVGVWLNADVGTRAPDSKTGRMQVKAGGKGTQGGSGSLAFRPGWHLGETPLATQFDRLNPETGVKELFPENFVWALCDIAADVDYQEEAMSYGYTKNGKFQHSLAGLPKLPADGYYKYRTNPNPDTVPWLITGAMKVKKLLSDEEVNAILEGKGLAPKQRVGGNKTLADLGLSEYEGVMFSERDTDALSNRSLLLSALEGTAQNEVEERTLARYKEKIGLINAEETRLKEVRAKIDEISRAKGKGKSKRLRELYIEAKQIENRINTYDRQLLELESTKALKRVLEREKSLARKRAEEKAMERYRERVAKDHTQLVERYRESRRTAVAKVTETRDKRDARARLQKLVLDTAKWISYPGKDDVKCPDILREPYATFLEGIDLSSKRLLEGGEPTKNDLRVANAMNSLASAIERITKAQDVSSEQRESLDSGYLDLPEDFVQKLREMAESITKMMVEGEYVINKMSSKDIRQLSQLIRTLNHAIKEMSTLYSNLRFANVEGLGDNTMTFLESMGEKAGSSGLGDFVGWDNALPYYAFKRFGEGGESIFTGLMDAQDKLASLASTIFEFKGKTWKDSESQAWGKDTHTIKLPSGGSLTLTSADAMGIYCLSRREQGLQHLLGGGTRVIGLKKGGKKASDSRSTLTQADIDAIVKTLTVRQKQVAEAIQEFMSTVCSEWGNEISMKRFLTREFIEPHYYPIESNDENLTAQDPKAQQSDLYRLLHISATKPLAPNANNEVIIRNIFEVFTQHASDMARLNAFGLPLLDYMKWVNYREKTTNKEGQITVRGVRKSMSSAYGEKAWSYVLNLIKDINGRNNDNGDNSFLMGMMRLQKTASVGNNLRVALLQFTSYPRASMVLSNKSLLLGLTKPPQITKAKKYCGIALWKSFGFYDTNIGRSIEDQIKGSSSIRQKIIELSMKGAEWADAITWGALWNACEYEVAKTTKNKVGSEEFYQEVGLKLREVVYATQVVDSVLTRSQIMRSKSGLTQMATSYMSEPTLTWNILMDAGFQFQKEKRISGSAKTAWKKTGKFVIGAVSNYCVLQLVASLAESLADAWRDDDEEEFAKKFSDAFGENLLTNIIPFNKIPILSDVVDLVLSVLGVGYVSSNDMASTWITDISTAFVAWSEVIGEATGEKNTNKTVYNAIYKTSKAISSLTGVSVSGAMREVVAVWNNTAGASDPSLKIKLYETSKSELGKALYDAKIGGNDEIAKIYEEMFEDQKDIDAALRKALRENDPRIKKAAEALMNGKGGEYNQLLGEIVNEGNFERRIVQGAIAAELEKMRDANK